uniref:DJ-1/PfpI domain-containing protein n=1 Tax=Oncorhynchus mykiss TaxID=8022 RepID=A0A8K9Y0T2_ONCMY
MVKCIAIVLSGCGVYDGTEIHEASAVLVHLSRAGAKVQMFAPDVDQMHVVNHCEGKPTAEKRNVLQESARIARGDVSDLTKLDITAFDALVIPGKHYSLIYTFIIMYLNHYHSIIYLRHYHSSIIISIQPLLTLYLSRTRAGFHCSLLCSTQLLCPIGGFGVAKNLCDWAVKGKEYTVQPQVEKLIKGFHGVGKPLAMCCISPVLAARALPGCEITVGQDSECERWPYAQTATTMTELGCKHVNKNVGEVHVDVKNKLVTTSAFMCNAPIHEVFDGVGVMVTELLKLT